MPLVCIPTPYENKTTPFTDKVNPFTPKNNIYTEGDYCPILLQENGFALLTEDNGNIEL
jgi:hypothetical protein